ncbi:MAG: Dabb family protein [Dysgonomonas sp.]|nr:Dabb family protein [Dysgonomonas sp.]
MIKHIVCWKLKDEAHGNDKSVNAKHIKEKLEALRGKIEGLVNIEVGINIPEYPTNYDVVLYSELESKEALEHYQNHPLHQALLPFIREAVSNRVAVDYEI